MKKVKKDDFIESIKKALEEIETTKSISSDVVKQAFEESVVKAYRKSLASGGIKHVEDADVRAKLDFDNGIITVSHVYQVVDEVEDDFLQKSAEELNKSLGKNQYKAGDEYVETYDVRKLNSTIMLNIATFFKQKISEAEKGLLYNAFKDKAGTILIGRVESCDEYGATVKINNATLELKRKDMIGDEMFAKNDPIRLYVSKVSATGSKGQQLIEVSRAHPGFLKALFTEEISDVYNGTIVIKGIARRAGERSKIAVCSNNPDIDPAATCIGQNGIRVQKIVGQLGNNNSSSEKVDVITWSDNPSVFITEAMKPAHLVGIIVDEGIKYATVVVNADTYPVAIGRKGVNVSLAKQLTGYHIDVYTVEKALEEELTYTPIEEIEALALSLKAQRITELQNAKKEKIIDSLPGLPEGYIKPEERKYDEEVNAYDAAFQEAEEKEELDNINIASETSDNNNSVEETNEIKEEVNNEKDSVKVNVATSGATLADFEASLEQESNKNKTKANYKKKRKNEDEKEETITHSSQLDPSKYMSIYDDDEEEEYDSEEYESDDDSEIDETYTDYEDNY